MTAQKYRGGQTGKTRFLRYCLTRVSSYAVLVSLKHEAWTARNVPLNHIIALDIEKELLLSGKGLILIDLRLYLSYVVFQYFFGHQPKQTAHKMEAIKVFLSSRVNSAFSILDPSKSLKDLRKYLQTELEKELFLGEKIFKVLINERTFDSTLSKDAFENCMDSLRSSHVIIILYNGEAGWPIADLDSSNGICHEEYLAAMQEFGDMSFGINISRFFKLPEEGKAWERNKFFADELARDFRHMETIEAQDFEELKTNCLTQIRRYLVKAVENSFLTQKRVVAGSSIVPETLDWSKLSYSERIGKMKATLQQSLDANPEFSDTICRFYAVPDSMSVADARNQLGRPFLYEQNEIIGSDKRAGVVHFIAVYGRVSATQAKNLVGYPDLTVIRTPFGFYLWEKNVHIQIFFLQSCVNSNVIKLRIGEVGIWLNSSREKANIQLRAQRRFTILKAINDAKIQD